MRPERQKMKSKIKYFCLLHIVLLIFSITSIASKFASGADFLSVKFCLCYGIVFAGLGVYAICWQQVIKHMPLVTAYANKAVTVIWGIVFGYLLFDEAITIRKILGGVIVIAGVYLIVTADAMEEENQRISNASENTESEAE